MTAPSGWGSKTALIALAGAVLLLGGCRWEKATGPNPTPTPSPNPTPTPNPTPQPSPTPNPTPFLDDEDTGSAMQNSFVHQVVYANAALLDQTANDAVNAASELRESLRRAVPSDSGSLTVAEAALAEARRAFFAAEPSLHYYSVEEFVPEGFEGLRATSPDLEPPAFAAVAQLLETYAAEPVDSAVLPSSRTLLLQDLSAAAADLESQLSAWADLWKDDSGFRHGVFLSDADAAAGRIFQGVVSAIDFVLEETGALDPESARIEQRLRGTQSLWTGIYQSGEGDLNFGAGLSSLVDSVSPGDAAAISENLAVLTAGSSEVDRVALITELRDQLVRAARALGYEVVEEEAR